MEIYGLLNIFYFNLYRALWYKNDGHLVKMTNIKRFYFDSNPLSCWNKTTRVEHLIDQVRIILHTREAPCLP